MGADVRMEAGPAVAGPQAAAGSISRAAGMPRETIPACGCVLVELKEDLHQVAGAGKTLGIGIGLLAVAGLCFFHFLFLGIDTLFPRWGWLAALIFDLTVVWHHYIRNAAVLDRLREINPLNTGGSKTPQPHADSATKKCGCQGATPPQ